MMDNADNHDDRGTTKKRAFGFARRHPALTTIGVVGIGLVGGLELAAGLLIGVGITALAYRSAGGGKDSHPAASAETNGARVSP